MKALQLHHMMRATTAIRNPEMVIARYFSVNSSERRGWGADEAADFQRSGSFTKRRTANATAAGMRPQRKTYRHETSGDWLQRTPAIWKLTEVARNNPM